MVIGTISCYACNDTYQLGDHTSSHVLEVLITISSVGNIDA